MNATAMQDNMLSADRPAGGLLGLAERGLLPDACIRAGVRRLCRQRLCEEEGRGPAEQSVRFQELLDTLRRSALAIETGAANAQHYELPPAFFRLCLGKRMKYSCCYFPDGVRSLDEAEAAMLAITAERAALANGQQILELGCGWGSLTFWMAERYPEARITAVSNSRAQGAYIRGICLERNLRNVKVVTGDINTLTFPAGAFDRCVSIEMFEHLRNYEALLERISAWLRVDGKLFVHLFAHQTLMYAFDTVGEDNWLGRHFFTGGLMPSTDTLLWFQRNLQVEQRWKVSGTHYARTANAWLANQDRHPTEVMAVLREAFGAAMAPLWFQRWRIFWMACAELFGYAGGRQWLVAHYRFVNAR